MKITVHRGISKSNQFSTTSSVFITSVSSIGLSSSPASNKIFVLSVEISITLPPI